MLQYTCPHLLLWRLCCCCYLLLAFLSYFLLYLIENSLCTTIAALSVKQFEWFHEEIFGGWPAETSWWYRWSSAGGQWGAAFQKVESNWWTKVLFQSPKSFSMQQQLKENVMVVLPIMITFVWLLTVTVSVSVTVTSLAVA